MTHVTLFYLLAPAGYYGRHEIQLPVFRQDPVRAAELDAIYHLPAERSASVVFLNVADSYLVHALPLTLALKQFHSEHYTTDLWRLARARLETVPRKNGAQL